MIMGINRSRTSVLRIGFPVASRLSQWDHNFASETCIQPQSDLPREHEVQVVAQLALAAEVFASRRYVHDQMSIDFEKRRSVGPCAYIEY